MDFKLKKGYSFTLLLLLVALGTNAQYVRMITLAEAIEIGAKENNQLKVSKAKVEIAEAKLQQAKDSELPTLGTSVQYNRLYNLSDFVMATGEESSFTLPETSVDAMIGITSLSKEIFGGFAHRAAHKTNKYLVEINKLNFLKDAKEIKYNIISLYHNIYKIIKTEEILDENLKLLDQKEREVQKLYKEGIVTYNEVLKIQLQKSNLQLSRVDVRSAYDIAINNLAILVGLPEEEHIAIDTVLTFSHPEIWDAGVLAATASTSRLEILSSAEQVKAAESGYRQFKSAYYPHLDFSVMHIYLNPAPNHNFIPNKNEFMNLLNVGFSLKYNIGSLYGLKGRKQEAKLNIEQARNSELLARDIVRQEVFSKYKNLKSAEKKIVVSNDALEQAKLNFKQTDSKFRNGLVLSSDLLEAQTLLQNAQLNLLESKVDAQIVFYQLEKSVGTTLNSN